MRLYLTILSGVAALTFALLLLLIGVITFGRTVSDNPQAVIEAMIAVMIVSISASTLLFLPIRKEINDDTLR